MRLVSELRDSSGVSLCFVPRGQYETYTPVFYTGRLRDVELMVDALEAVGL